MVGDLWELSDADVGGVISVSASFGSRRFLDRPVLINIAKTVAARGWRGVALSLGWIGEFAQVKKTDIIGAIMSTDSQHLLNSFDALPPQEQREVVSELLRKAALWDSPPLTDDDLARLADEAFLELDRREAADGS